VSRSLRVLKAKAAQQGNGNSKVRSDLRKEQRETLPHAVSEPIEMWKYGQPNPEPFPWHTQNMYQGRFDFHEPRQDSSREANNRVYAQPPPGKQVAVSPVSTTSSTKSARSRPSSRGILMSQDGEDHPMPNALARSTSTSSGSSGKRQQTCPQELVIGRAVSPNRNDVAVSNVSVDSNQHENRSRRGSNVREEPVGVDSASDSGWSSFDISPRGRSHPTQPDKWLSEHMAETRAWETLAEAQLALLRSQNEEQAEQVSSLVAHLRVMEATSAEQTTALQEASVQRRTSLQSLSQLEAFQAKHPASENEYRPLERVPECSIAPDIEASAQSDCNALRQHIEQLVRELAVSDAARAAAVRDAHEFKQHAEQLVINHATSVSDEIQDLDSLRKRTEQLQLELEASDAEKVAAQREAQRARQAVSLVTDELGERTKVAQALNQRLQNEHEDAQNEISSLARARHQLEAQLDGCEMARESLERRLLAQQAQLHDSQTRCDETSSGLRQAQFQGETMRKELRQAHAQAEQSDALANAQHRLKAELLQCQSDLHDVQKANQQGSICVNQLRQENEQMVADSRAAAVLADSLRRELRDASDRATAQHADNCDLRISLETSRLEIERLRDTLATAQRENIMLQRQLRQRLSPGATGSKLNASNELNGPLRRTSDSCGNSSSGADDGPLQAAMPYPSTAIAPIFADSAAQKIMQPSGASVLPPSVPSSPGMKASPSEVGDSVARVLHHGQNTREQELERDKQVACIEKQLMVLNAEKKQLENTMMKFPSNGAGRTLAHRRQKREVEQRAEEVDRTLSELRQKLRQIDGRR